MHLLILSLLMAFGGQTTFSDSGTINITPLLTMSTSPTEGNFVFPRQCKSEGVTIKIEDGTFLAVCEGGIWHGIEVGCAKPPCNQPEISLHPYPLWRMEAQEPGMKVFGPILTLDCINCGTIDPIDVPALQVDDSADYKKMCAAMLNLERDADFSQEKAENMKLFKECKHISWTCTDPSRSLESSVDGLKHWCHRMSQ